MKNTILSFLLLLTYFFSFSQVKISELPTFSGNAENAVVPVTINGVTYKTTGKNFAIGKVDSIIVKKASGLSPDSLYSWKSGVKTLVSIIPKVAAGADTVINGSYYGSLSGLRSLTDTSVRVGYINDYGGGTFAQDRSDNSSADNTWRIIVAASGRRYVRKDFDGIELKADWFIPPAADADAADKTAYLQSAINAAVRLRLIYTNGRIYTHDRLNIVDGIKINLNGAIIKSNGQYSNSLYILDPSKLNAAGVSDGGTYSATRKNPKRISPVEVYGGIFQLDNAYVGSVECNLTGIADNCVVEKFYVHDIIVSNFSRRAIGIVTNTTKTDSSAYVVKGLIDHNSIFYGGVNIGLCLDSSYSVGETRVRVRTINGQPMKGRTMEGRFIQLASHYDNNTLANTTYTGTNTLFRIDKIIPNANDSSKADFVLIPGGYNNSDGFTDSTGGIRADVIKNAYIIPVEPFDHPTLFTMAGFSGTAGSKKMTRVAQSSFQNATGKNSYKGVKVMVPNQPGEYIIDSVFANDSIWVTPNVRTTFSSQLLTLVGAPAACIYTAGDIRNSEISWNNLYAASHGVNDNGLTCRGCYNEDLPNNTYMHDNTIELMWMSKETQTGVTVRNNLTYTILDSVGVALGGRVVNLINTGSIRQSAKDFGDGVTRKFVTLTANNDAASNTANSIIVGSILVADGYRTPLLLTDVSSTTFTLVPWNQVTRDTIAGGFERKVDNTARWYVVYNPLVGQEGSIRYQKIEHNTFKNLWRNSGGAGYQLSTRANEIEILNNNFEDADHAVLEIVADKGTITNNILNLSLFDGTIPKPSLSKKNGGPGRGFGGVGSIVIADCLFDNNQINGVDLPSYNWSGSCGDILLGKGASSLFVQKQLKINNSIWKGLRGDVLNVVNFSSVAGTKYPVFCWDNFEFTGNTVALNKYYSGSALFNYLLGKKVTITGTTFTKNDLPAVSGQVKLFLTNQKIAPYLVDSAGVYDYVIENNTYPTVPLLNIPRTQIRWWNDLKDANPFGTNGYLYNNNGATEIRTPSGSGSNKNPNGNF
ncbi:MAG: hypothetical protein QM802_19860 [Agriterribacter sp.]